MELGTIEIVEQRHRKEHVYGNLKETRLCTAIRLKHHRQTHSNQLNATTHLELQEQGVPWLGGQIQVGINWENKQLPASPE